MSWKLTLEDIDQYKSVFAVCDKDHDGFISVTEMAKIMRTLGKNFSESEFEVIKNNINTEHEGLVELHEFLELMAKNKADQNTIKHEQIHLIEAFSYFDRDKNGYIDYQEFRHILTTVSEKLNSVELGKLDDLCKPYVTNGKLKYQEFMQTILLR